MGQVVLDDFATPLIPERAEYAVLLPDGHDTAAEPLPLLITLHGGGQDRGQLRSLAPHVESLWASGELPPVVVVVAPTGRRNFFVDFRDGSQRWESMLLGPLLERVHARFRVAGDRRRTLLHGISMGGLAALRIAFRHPQSFGAVAVSEPAIYPAIDFADVRDRNAFFHGQALLEQFFGSDVDGRRVLDRAYWRENHPPSLAFDRSEAIRASGLEVYLEVGDEDSLNLSEGSACLHRILWDRRIPHEFHLVRWGDHGGPTLPRRLRESLAFLGRFLTGVDRMPARPAGDRDRRRREAEAGTARWAGEFAARS
jgi:S-formylglutathione hydrolase